MLYRLSDLKRYNNMPRIKSESLAEHQYYCGLILIKLKEYITNVTYSEYCILLQYLLVHDIGELYTGDIPHNVKQDYPDLRYMLEEIEYEKLSSLGFSELAESIEKNTDLKTLFKLCDTIQVVQYCENEKRLGNHSTEIDEILETAFNLVTRQVNTLKQHGILKNEFDEQEFLNKLC